MLKNSLKLLVRADAGPTVGTGHIMRTLALGQAWKRLGGSVTFVCGELPKALIKRIESEQFQIFQIQHDHCDTDDARELAKIAAAITPDWIVVDGYRFDDAYQQHLRQSSGKLLVVDDYGHASHANADFVLNQNVYGNPTLYPNLNQSKILAGPQYVLLRSEFTTAFPQSAEPKKIVKEARRVLVTFGGADPDNWTLKTLQTLSDLNRKRLVVDCVVGACYQHGAELEMFKKSANMSLRIHRNVDRMTSLMLRADLAITAGGSTCYELARCGVPSIVMSIADNQKPIAFALSEKNVMISIDSSDSEINFSQQGIRLKTTIRQLINNPGRRYEMSENGKRLVDGKGAKRIAENLMGSCFTLRKAQLDDSATMWQWQNDPEVRSVSLTPNPISLADHRNSIRQQIDDPQTTIWISEDPTGRKVGQVKFEKFPNSQTTFIDVIVDQAQRGRGVGSILINRACRQFFENPEINEIIAQIKPGNTASEKAFRAAGFHAIEPVIVNGKIACQFLRMRKNEETIVAQSFRRSA